MAIAIDIETKDPNIKKLGPGGVRNDGTLLGVAYAMYAKDTLVSEYYTEPGLINSFLPVAYDNDIVGANVLYDLEWLISVYKYRPKASIIDIQLAERIINPNSISVKLDTLAVKYLDEHKASDALQEWWEEAAPLGRKKFKGQMAAKGRAIENMDLVPIDLVSRYAKKDAELTLRIWDKQKTLIEADPAMKSAFERESKLLNILLQIRLEGLPFTRFKSKEIEESLVADEKNHLEIIAKALPGLKEELNVKTHEHKEFIASYCDKNSIPYLRTEKTGKPQITKKWLKSQSDTLFKSIAALEENRKLRNDFVVNIRKFLYSDKIYYCLHPFKSGAKDNDDENGTITGRLSSTSPNLQQIPIRNKKFGKMIRSQFFAPEGFTWVKADYSQQEVRMFIHLACTFDLEQAFAIQEKYLKDPKTDFYNVIVELCHNEGYTFIARDDAKMLLLAAQYGMGARKLAYIMEIEMNEAKKLLDAFFDTFPFIKEMQRLCANKAEKDGYVTTIGGRKIYFDQWEYAPSFDKRKLLNDGCSFEDRELGLTIDQDFLKKSFSEQELLQRFDAKQRKKFRRAFTYKALNYIVQGSCADVTKQAMINCYESGLRTSLQVHDELDFILPVDENFEDKLKAIKYQMENTFDISVPMLVDIETGPSWGEVEEVKVDLKGYKIAA